MAGTNEFCLFFAVKAYVPGGVQNQGRKKFEKCLPAGTGTKIYFSRKGPKKEGQVQIRETPRLNPPRLAALDWGVRISEGLGYPESQFAVRSDSNRHPLRNDCPKNRTIRIARPRTVRIAGNALIFFSLFFWKMPRKPTQKARIFIPAEPLKSLGKKGKTLKKARKSKKARKRRPGCFTIFQF